MSSYDEHLISQAGGDGDTFADRMARKSIEAKVAKHTPVPMWEAMDCEDVTDDPFYADFTTEQKP